MRSLSVVVVVVVPSGDIGKLTNNHLWALQVFSAYQPAEMDDILERLDRYLRTPSQACLALESSIALVGLFPTMSWALQN